MKNERGGEEHSNSLLYGIVAIGVILNLNVPFLSKT